MYIHIYINIFRKIGPKCGKWEYGCLKMWEVGRWVSNNVGSGTMVSNNVGSGTMGVKIIFILTLISRGT